MALLYPTSCTSNTVGHSRAVVLVFRGRSPAKAQITRVAVALRGVTELWWRESTRRLSRHHWARQQSPEPACGAPPASPHPSPKVSLAGRRLPAPVWQRGVQQRRVCPEQPSDATTAGFSLPPLGRGSAGPQCAAPHRPGADTHLGRLCACRAHRAVRASHQAWAEQRQARTGLLRAARSSRCRGRWCARGRRTPAQLPAVKCLPKTGTLLLPGVISSSHIGQARNTAAHSAVAWKLPARYCAVNRSAAPERTASGRISRLERVVG